jgi:DNA-binding NarL/FixJ family response regulator
VAIRVVLGEDSFLVREGIATVLENLDGVELVEAARDLDELRASVERTNPDVVVTDIRMPPSNTDEGIRFADELRSSHPEVGVVILSQHAEPRYAMALLSGGSGRRAYLLKERLTDQAELNQAVQNVAAGESLIDPRVVEKLVSAREKWDSELGSDRSGPQQYLDRGEADDHQASRRAPYQRHLPQARPGRARGRESSRPGCASVPGGRARLSTNGAGFHPVRTMARALPRALLLVAVAPFSRTPTS